MHSFNKDSDWDDMSSAAKLRKIRKPLVERRRRERINTSMLELKSLILQAMCKRESDYEKMEKADILEMTVHYLRTLHRARQAHAVNTFHDGFQECAKEVRRYLGSTPGLGPNVRMRMDQHLSTSGSRTQSYPDIVKPEATKLTPAQLPMASPAPFLTGLYGCQETPLSSITALNPLQPEDFFSVHHSLSVTLPTTSSATVAKLGESQANKHPLSLSESAASATCSSNVRRNLFEQELAPSVKNELPATGEGSNGGEPNNNRDAGEQGAEDSDAWRPWK